MSAAKNRPMHASSFPVLAQFAAGYLHEDFVLEHQTPAGARDAFMRDANATERAAFAKEAVRYCSEAKDAAWADVRASFESLGGAWRPASRAALLDVLTPKAPAGAVVSGTVSGSDQGIVPGASVVIDGPEQREARTDADGRFTFTNVPRGRYRLVVTAEPYQPLDRNMDVGDASVSVDIVLLRLPGLQ